MQVQPLQVQPLLRKSIHYCILLRLNKPIGILLLLWPTLIAVWIAGYGHPEPRIVFIFILGVIIMRSAGCVVNDIADQNFDAKVKRTRLRPITSGQVTNKEAYFIFCLLLFLACILVLQLNTFTLFLSIISLLLSMIYPFMKRITHLPQLVLGITFSMAIPMAFVAQLNALPTIAWYLVIANSLWVIAYDTQYAMVDREDDIKIGVKSTAILFGQMDRLMILFLQILSLSIFLWIGLSLKLSNAYYLGILAATLLMCYQFVLTYQRDPHQCLKAFLNNNLFGAVIFAGLYFSY